MNRAKALLASGFNAGEGYGEVWIRDLATFIELSAEVQEATEIRDRLLMFLRFQGADGNIVDGYIPAAKRSENYDFIVRDSVPGFLAHKNTVATDQESSLVQAVARYVRSTSDDAILRESIDGRTVLERLEMALEFLLEKRWSAEHGLLWGGTTADWGDVQPGHEWGVVFDENSRRAIDVYDNAMFAIAIADLLELLGDDAARRQRWERVRDDLRANIRAHLWDPERQRFVPHLYLDQSPFPESFDESAVFYHGGTAVAIEAGLLSREEIAASLRQMRENVRRAGAASIGLTLYPAYPRGFFQNPLMREPYSYQNGGDWTWFGARMVQQLVAHGFAPEAYREIKPMVARVLRHDGFWEWWTLDNQPAGWGTFRGSAGVLGRAIQMLRAWAIRASAAPATASGSVPEQPARSPTDG